MKFALSAIIAGIIVLLFAIQAIVPLQNPVIYPVGSESYWMKTAEDAWEYFEPGNGVDAVTGLHAASIGYPLFTDWDLGLYIQTIIDAEKIGVLQRDGDWGADSRFEKLISFLENRELTSNGLPYWWYESQTGKRSGDGSTDEVDTGKLLVALYNLKVYRPELVSRIDYVVYEHSNYTDLWPKVSEMINSASIYGYYVACGFADFWPTQFSAVADSILNNIDSAPKVEAYGVELPLSDLLGDPLLFSVFELKSDPRLLSLAKQFYLAHEARYNVTGKFVAFSEGNTGVGNPSFAYEFTVLSNGQTWVIKDSQFSDANIPEVIYYKVALGFLAMYPTTFSRELVSYLDATSPPRTKGYTDGVNENGQIVSTIVDKTNGLIISAARYALENSNYVVSSWRDSDMGAFPWPFIQNGNLNNTTIVIGKNKLNNSGGSAQSTDAIGGILLTQKLTRNSSTGELVAVLDDWSIYGDLASGNVNLIDKETNLIVLGNPRVNSISYFYNCLRDQFGEPMVPVVFVEGLDENNTYLYVPNTGSVYETEFNEDGTVAKDYGVIMEFQDQFERYVIMVYGLEAEGTLGTCKFLCDYKNWSYNATALIIQSSGTKLNYYPSDSSVVEVITC